MLLTAGYFQTTYWPEDYWNDNFWQNYGLVEWEPFTFKGTMIDLLTGDIKVVQLRGQYE